MAHCTRVGTSDRLQHGLQRQGIHHRGQHAHVVGRRALHAAVARAHPAPEIAAADHHRDLQAGLVRRFDLVGDVLDDGRRDVVVIARLPERLATEFQENASKFSFAGRGIAHVYRWSWPIKHEEPPDATSKSNALSFGC